MYFGSFKSKLRYIKYNKIVAYYAGINALTIINKKKINKIIKLTTPNVCFNSRPTNHLNGRSNGGLWMRYCEMGCGERLSYLKRCVVIQRIL